MKSHNVHDPKVASAKIIFGYFPIFLEMVASTGANGGSLKKGAIHSVSLGVS